MFGPCLIRLKLNNWFYFMICQLSEYKSSAKYLSDTMVSNPETRSKKLRRSKSF